MPERDREAVAPARSFWSGTLTFGLVNIPVDLFAAVRPRRISMKMVDAKGRPLGRQYVCSEDGKTLQPDDIVRGYETEDGQTIVVTDEELQAIAPELTRDIELRRFVPLEQIEPAYYQRPYFLVPAGRSAKAYHLLAATMARTRRAGIGTFVMRGHQYLVAIVSEDGVLRAQTLRFADELRTPRDIGLPKPSKPPAKALEAMAGAVDALMRDALDLDELADRYAADIRALAEKKEKKGEDVIEIGSAAEEEDDEAGGAEVIDLVQLLKQRLKAKAEAKSPAAPPRAAAPVRTLVAARSKRDDGLRARRLRGKGAAAKPRKPAARGAPRGADRAKTLSKEALYERAQALGIPGRSTMSRKQLEAAVRKAG